ncbi:hypothetical protein HYPSUDRAFT_141230 [Hypholoma sublateritium FD-334 SS-4]|uniref:Mitochondrial adapter protein MCP1 transmembrane domain-containing protein n=1 Tax=Hypholoma sublateritium (strain FD-334 SS-4) TaxID=945553 RepID=A0A0D2NQQ2_HYPSF|nr:hypothetical protein HYPSUDRAFT_141230 [Hypholoma sublateritium FD-334 SS-4]
MLGLNWSSVRARALPALTVTAHITAPFIGAFLVVHLTAPALATVGGASLASQTMILGREYYQTALSEPLLLLAPLSLHALAAGLKRVLTFFSPKSRPTVRPLTHPLTLSAIFLLFLLPTHYLTHRLYPTIAASPILAVGPAELDFAFVQAGLAAWPVRSALMYAGLVCAGAVHAAEGLSLLRRRYLPAAKAEGQVGAPSKRVITPRVQRTVLALGLGALPVLAGVYALAREHTFVFADLASRYHAVFTQSWVYRL